ncbi:MAG: beta-propeller fold lactonase family protein [Candidatus Eremiobacteraeota bacterium]|nr:beta-propeller fold lactonase family protein [Candidatus Eremiobacteraeota bacterium]
MVVRTQHIALIIAAACVAAILVALFASAPRAADVTALPNGWRITPAGSTIVPLGTLPLRIAQSPYGRWLAISNAGYGDLSLTIVNQDDGAIADSKPMAHTFYGLAFSPTEDALYASTASDGGIARFPFDSATGKLGDPTYLPLGSGKLWVNGLAVSLDGSIVYAAVSGANDLVAVRARSGAIVFASAVGNTPYGVVMSSNGARVYVSNWGGSSISVVDSNNGAMLGTIATDPHPGAMLIGADARTLYVACANENVVDVIDTLTGKMRGKIDVALYPNSPAGSTPDGLALSADGRTLYVADADSNAVVAVDVTTTAPILYGAIPVGWYPTDVAMSKDGKRMYVLDGKGLSGHANPDFMHSSIVPRAQSKQTYYAPNTATGDLETVTALSRSALIGGLAVARANSPFKPLVQSSSLPPFKHVIYVIKENRTYDEVLGDDTRGNGSESLAVFGQKVTPNIHRLADDFVLLDAFYSEGTVSADGHEWADGAYADDFVQRMWPADYAGRADGFYDYANPILRPSAGYIWDLAIKRGLTVRLYGEGGVEGSSPARGLDAATGALLDPAYRPFDVTYSDQDRIVEWLREFRQFEASGQLPNLEVVWLPSDHTAAMRAGARTPYAMIADNDYALGRMIEALSHSRYWKDTLLVSIEDDAQAGPDHVSNQRIEALVISAYANRGMVDHTHYTTSSVLRTIELAFGLPPLSQFDASATPLSGVFTQSPDLRPWRASLPNISLTTINPPSAAAQASASFDLSTADAVDPDQFNAVLAKYLKDVRM